MVETDQIDREYDRKVGFLREVAECRAKLIVAERQLRAAQLQATRGGCMADEVAGAIRMIDRAAG